MCRRPWGLQRRSELGNLMGLGHVHGGAGTVLYCTYSHDGGKGWKLSEMGGAANVCLLKDVREGGRKEGKEGKGRERKRSV